jgi:hypothetical protein
MAKWCYKLEEQNGILVQQNLIWKNMIRALDGYQKVKHFLLLILFYNIWSFSFLPLIMDYLICSVFLCRKITEEKYVKSPTEQILNALLPMLLLKLEQIYMKTLMLD